MGRIKTPGGDQELRTPTLIRDHPIRGEGQRDFLGESEGSPPPQPHDSFLDAGEAKNDFWSMSRNFIYRRHAEPRVKLYSSRESLPFPLKYIDATCASDLQPWLPTCMACVSMSLLTTSSLPGRTRSTHSTSLPPQCRWGHNLSSTGRPSRHRLGPSSCLFCHDVDGSLAHHLSSCSAHINARTAWAHSCGVSPSDVPAFARHGWVFNPLDESNTPQTIRAHICFVGLVCKRLQRLSW